MRDFYINAKEKTIKTIAAELRIKTGFIFSLVLPLDLSHYRKKNSKNTSKETDLMNVGKKLVMSSTSTLRAHVGLIAGLGVGLILAGCASPLKSDLSKYRGLVMDADLAKSRGGVGNYVFQESNCGCDHKKESATVVAPKAEAAPASAGAPVAKLVGKKIEISQQVVFNFGKATLTTKGKDVLDQVAKVITENQDKIQKVNIEGHTDHVGSAEKNLKLSDARANSVMKYLVSKGIKSDIFTAKGYGFTRPKYELKGATKEQLAENRRVEFECQIKE